MNRHHGLCCIAAGLLAVAAGCGGQGAAESAPTKSPRALNVEVIEIQPSRIEMTLELVGTLIPIRATTIVSEVDGIIQSFPLSDRKIQFETNGRKESVALGLDIGNPVKKGQVICQIDPTDFQLELDAAKANLNLAQKNLEHLFAWRRPEEVAQMEAQVKEAEATHARCAADLARSLDMVKDNAVSRSKYDQDLMAERTSAAVLERAQAALKLAKAGPTPEEIAVGKAQIATAEVRVKQCEERLHKTSIRAPYDAVVSERYVDVGERVTAMPRVEILQIVDPRVLLAEVAVPERYQDCVKLDTVAAVEVAGRAESVPGVVDLINEKIDPQTRTVRVRVSIDNRQGLLRPGGLVKVHLPIAMADEVLCVPRRAVVMSEGRLAVFVCKDGVVQRREVEPGISNATCRQIRAGLDAGDRVVIDKPGMMADGMTVQAHLIDTPPEHETPHAAKTGDAKQ
ncbi:MAG: efflux RND transporter periplasmic adaptor subunit [Pirellulales bacterium]|nr:efflux RND transporter periplasmic adaptor subunit [Pirellulales bacterium]